MEIISRNSSLKEFDFNHGEVILVNKPEGWSSFEVIKRLRPILRTRKVGHAGTLDPFATGLLIICTGRATKKVNDFMDLDKTYEGTFTFGKTTETFDRTGKITGEKKDFRVSKVQIEEAIKKFVGVVDQIPPMFSARKVGGIRLYQMARKGKEVVRESRKIHISRFEVTRYQVIPAEKEDRIEGIDFELNCSKGTYVRTLADDLGRELGCGAYVERLKRSRIGPYRSSDAWTLEDLKEFLEKK